jgi:hypothetical protein
MNKNLKYLLILVLLGLLAGGYIGYRMWNKPHRDVAGANADSSLEATNLYLQFATDEAAANANFLDKIVQVCGQVAEVSTDNESVSVLLDTGDPFGGVACELDHLTEHPRTEFPAGERVCFKGVCTGYLSDVVLSRCTEVK